MNGYYLAEAAASRHEELLRTAALRRRAREARPTTRRVAERATASRDGRWPPARRGPVAVVRAFIHRGWIAPPATMVRGSVPGDGRGAVAGNLAFGPAGTATCPEFRVAAGHGAS